MRRCSGDTERSRRHWRQTAGRRARLFQRRLFGRSNNLVFHYPDRGLPEFQNSLRISDRRNCHSSGACCSLPLFIGLFFPLHRQVYAVAKHICHQPAGWNVLPEISFYLAKIESLCHLGLILHSRVNKCQEEISSADSICALPVQIPTSELGTASKKVQTATSELGTASKKVQTVTSQLGTASKKVQIPTSEPGNCD